MKKRIAQNSLRTICHDCKILMKVFCGHLQIISVLKLKESWTFFVAASPYLFSAIFKHSLQIIRKYPPYKKKSSLWKFNLCRYLCAIEFIWKITTRQCKLLTITIKMLNDFWYRSHKVTKTGNTYYIEVFVTRSRANHTFQSRVCIVCSKHKTGNRK